MVLDARKGRLAEVVLSADKVVIKTPMFLLTLTTCLDNVRIKIQEKKHQLGALGMEQVPMLQLKYRMYSKSEVFIARTCSWPSDLLFGFDKFHKGQKE